MTYIYSEDRYPSTNAPQVQFDLQRGDLPGWIDIEFKFKAGAVVTNTDVIVLLPENSLRGWQVMDYRFRSDLIHADVLFHGGIAGSATGISGSTGARWFSRSTKIGRSATRTALASDDESGDFLLQRDYYNPVGLQLANDATLQTPDPVIPGGVWAGKRIWLSLRLQRISI